LQNAAGVSLKCQETVWYR